MSHYALRSHKPKEAKMKVYKWTLAVLIGTAILGLGLGSPRFLEAASSKRVIVIGGVPPEWLVKRVTGNAIAEAIERKTPYGTKIVEALGLVSRERFGALMDGKIDITLDISGRDMLHETLTLVDPALAQRFQYVALFPEHWQPLPLIVHKDLPINSWRDAIAKKYPLKVGTGRGGSYGTVNLIWKTMGVGHGVDEVAKWGGKVDKANSPNLLPPMIREGSLNAYMCLGETWEPGLEEVNSIKPLKLLPVAEDDNDLNKIKKDAKSLERFVMKAGHYKFVSEDVRILGCLKFYVACPKLTNEEAYQIVKAVWDEREFMAKSSVDTSNALKPEIVKMARKMDIPFHPGAERFYREAGMW